MRSEITKGKLHELQFDVVMSRYLVIKILQSVLHLYAVIMQNNYHRFHSLLTLIYVARIAI